MNQYGLLARRYFEERLPSRASSMTGQDYQQLGETIEQQIADLAVRLEGTDDPAETHLQKVGRLTNARSRARETVLQEWLYAHPPEPAVAWQEAEHDRDPEMEAITDSARELRDLLAQIDDETPQPPPARR